MNNLLAISLLVLPSAIKAQAGHEFMEKTGDDALLTGLLPSLVRTGLCPALARVEGVVVKDEFSRVLHAKFELREFGGITF